VTESPGRYLRVYIVEIVLTVWEGEVHQLENSGSVLLIVIIICPASHIGTDRFIVQGRIPH
jgi:hypothetical protein